MLRKWQVYLKLWLGNERGSAALEAALVFPVMIVMLFGIVDIGKGLILNKKVLSASQMASDLLARNDTVTDGDIDEAVAAARMAITPYNVASFGIDIVGVRFTGGAANPSVEWRDTFGMGLNDEVLVGSNGLGDEDEGVIAVTVSYTYTPPYSSFIAGDIYMEEVAYVRGRGSSFIVRE